jgi:hypothetical protein
MNKILGTTLLSFALIASANAGMITMDPSVFDPGTDVTQAYEGATLYSASGGSAGLTLRSTYVATCTDCRGDGVRGDAVFSPNANSSQPIFAYAEEVSKTIRGLTSDGGIALLVNFDEPTDYVQVVGSGAWLNNAVRMDYWDESGALLGTCIGQTDANCTSTRLFNDPDYYDDQKRYSLRISDPLIKFVTIGGHVGGANIAKVSYVKVPEPSAALALSAGLLALAGFRRRKTGL